MIFTETRLRGVLAIEPDRRSDERGFFARTYCAREFADRGLNTHWVQGAVSFNRSKGTLRGLHWQAAPHEEIKLVRCSRGSIHDVVVDLRPESATYRGWVSMELTVEGGRLLYIPKGCAHGYLTLTDDTEVVYQLSEFYDAGYGRGVRWDDPVLNISWPMRPSVMSARDRSFPGLDR